MRNSGWFQKGDDPRRHPLTRQERQCGGIMAQILLRLGAIEAYFQTDEELNAYLHRQRLRLAALGFTAKSFRLHHPMADGGECRCMN